MSIRQKVQYTFRVSKIFSKSCFANSFIQLILESNVFIPPNFFLFTDPLHAYPSIKQLSLVKVKKIDELCDYFQLSEDQMCHVRDSQHPTTEIFIAAKVKNMGLRWKEILEALMRMDECSQVGLVYSEQGWFTSK